MLLPLRHTHLLLARYYSWRWLRTSQPPRPFSQNGNSSSCPTTRNLPDHQCRRGDEWGSRWARAISRGVSSLGALLLGLIISRQLLDDNQNGLVPFPIVRAASLPKGDGVISEEAAKAEENQVSDTANECTVVAKKRRKKKIGFRDRRIIEYENRIRAYSTPDKIFRYFATLKVNNDDGTFEIFMTPEDFVRSLTPGVMQPRRWGLDKFKAYDPNKTRVQYAGRDTIFQWCGGDAADAGLISFADYLFLMTLLSTSPSDFRLAFHVFDINGDGVLDREEFDRVQELVLKQSNVGQRHRDHATPGHAVPLRKSKSSAVARHFFGRDSCVKLSVEEFLNFQQNLHSDILKIEFERRDPETGPEGVISEVSFAQLLLLHAGLHEKRQNRMMKRVLRKYKQMPNKKGVSLAETYAFFTLLYRIDKVDMALHFYKLAGRPLNGVLIQRLARKLLGVEISDTVVDVVIALFDENGDGQLSQREFVAIMRRRMQRGLDRPKDTGLWRFIDALWECGKKQLPPRNA